MRSSLASLYRTIAVLCISARSPGFISSPSCAEEASPISKCLVLRGSRAILFLNRSSIFQQEVAGPTANMALVPLPRSSSYRERRQGKPNASADTPSHPINTYPAPERGTWTVPRTRKLRERGVIPPPLQFELAGCFPNLRGENYSANEMFILMGSLFQQHTFPPQVLH